MVADVVQRLHQPGPDQELLDDLAAGAGVMFKVVDLAVRGGPVVHHVDDGLACQ
ncbi:hypothetical protein ACFFX0_26255 [Citricoccus parietis]|uniref:Uncharacterized protein n=1 Tax=Citricoccus parietis TaxID=592307 RepID=A0ABV5G6E0_9MICC